MAEAHTKFSRLGLDRLLAGISALIFIASAEAQDCEWSYVGNAPPRYAHAMVYDSHRDVMVLFGGSVGSERLGDTWEWDGQAWTLASLNGPSPRSHHAMAYDSARGVTVLFGGRTSTEYLWDTWEWDGQSWTQVSDAGPGRRWLISMAFDTRRGVSILFDSMLSDTWQWDGRNWTLLSDVGPALSTVGQAMAYDSGRDVMVLYAWRETWEWNGAVWTQVNLKSGAPHPTSLTGHAMCYDPVRGVTVLFGGGGGRLRDETWEWDGSCWLDANHTAPGARDHFGMAYDTARERIMIASGFGSSGLLDSAWEYACIAPFELVIDATCPDGGPIRIEWSGATPRGRGALLFGRRTGASLIPLQYACAGTTLGLARPVHLLLEATTGAGGNATIVAEARAAACGGHMQLVDVTTCNTSNVARLE